MMNKLKPAQSRACAKPTTAAIYARSATFDEAQISVQVATARDFCTTADMAVAGLFIEQSVDQKGLKQIIADAEQGSPRSFDILVVPSVCRLSRDPDKAEGYVSRLLRAGIEVSFCHPPGRLPPVP